MTPLSFRMAPKTLEQYVGQEHILGKDKLLYKQIVQDKLTSIILWGPPASGKTSLAKVIANTTKIPFKTLNAVSSGVNDIKKVAEDALNFILNPTGKVILFIDEIHRFNKSQQDVLLPFVEKGTIILIGATTENPYFEVNKAIISRTTVLKLEALSIQDIIKILKNTLADKENGLGNLNIKIENDTLEHIAKLSNQDARFALNTLEKAIIVTDIETDGSANITKDIVNSIVYDKNISYDKNGDSHYDTISAMIKSIRGSDADAAVFYLARLIAGGEDPIYIARRLVISACEDIGMANPDALNIATNGLTALQNIGMPEGRIILSQVCIYLATSQKSNSTYMAINNALEDVKTKNTGSIPLHLRNISTMGLENHDYNKGYKYPHDFPNNYVEQQYLPEVMIETVYYKPTDNGHEKYVNQYLKQLKNL